MLINNDGALPSPPIRLHVVVFNYVRRQLYLPLTGTKHTLLFSYVKTRLCSGSLLQHLLLSVGTG
jgi:hypothetical protein